MRNSKVFSVLLISVLMLTFVTTVVSATWVDSIVSVLNGIQDAGDPIFSALLGATNTTGDLFVKILAFLLVTFIVYGVLSTVNIFGEDRGWLNVIIGAIIAIIGIRFIPDDFLTQMALPSSAFVALIVMGLPFILLFFLIQKLPSLVRRAIWAVYAALIFFMWVYNYDAQFWYVYWLIIAACVVAFAFDGVLGRFFRKAKTGRTLGKHKDKQISKLKAEIMKDTELLAHTPDPVDKKRIKDEIQDKKDAIADLEKM